MTRGTTWTLCAAIALTASACGGTGNNAGSASKDAGAPSASATPPSPQVGDGPFKPPPIVVNPTLPAVKIDGATGSLPLSSAASYGWSAFIALNWPASTAANTRGVPDSAKVFGQSGIPTWITMRSKVEVFPGNATALVPPHGVVLDPVTHKPVNGPDYGYGDTAQYYYSTGLLSPCAGQPAVTPPPFIVMDETTQIDNNQTFAGAAPADDPQGYNSKPQLIRYAVKMNPRIYSYAMGGQYWYSGKGSPLATAEANYVTALNAGTGQDPATPYVAYPPPPGSDPNLAGIEVKSAWRPLTTTEATSGHFLTSAVRYYEQPGGGSTSCYREAVWGLVGMHVISFSSSAPWVIWTTFEQADNILTADGKATEDVNGNRVIPVSSPTTPGLTSDPNVLNPIVTSSGAYCANPGSQLYFRENPKYKTMPSKGNICVNGRWTQPEPIFVNANLEAHAVLSAYLASHGQKSSPLMYYKLVGAQGVPVDYDARNGGTFSTATSYYSANVTIETDYSLGNFTGHLPNGVPTNLIQTGGQTVPYYNTQLLPFQAARLGFGKMRMGGCAGCHGISARSGRDFSFALGNNVTQPEKTNALGTPNLQRSYFLNK